MRLHNKFAKFLVKVQKHTMEDRTRGLFLSVKGRIVKTTILNGYLPSQSNMKKQLNIGCNITHALNMLWHYMMHQWIALYISFPSMYGSAMETSPEKNLLHNIPNIRYANNKIILITCTEKIMRVEKEREWYPLWRYPDQLHAVTDRVSNLLHRCWLIIIARWSPLHTI